MTLFERKAIKWLKSIDDPRNPTEEGYYAQLILAMLEGLDEQSVSDLLSHIDELEGEVERLKDILDYEGVEYSEYEV